MQPIYAAGIVFVGVALFVVLISYLVTGRSAGAREHLERYTSSPASSSVVIQQPSSDLLPTVSRFLSSRGLAEMMMLEISRAGLRWRPSEFAVLVAVCAIAPTFIVAMLGAEFVQIVLVGIIGLSVPICVLKFRQQRRLNAFNDQIADALSLMASSLRSGYSFMRGMQVVSNEMPAPISEEFTRVIDDCNVGVPTEDALGRLVQRMNSYDMELVITAVTIQIQLGGNLAEILDTIAETIRERVRINGEVAALTADGRLSGIILIALPIFLFIVIFLKSPHYLDPLLKQQFGKAMLWTAGACMVLGAWVIRKLLRIDF